MRQIDLAHIKKDAVFSKNASYRYCLTRPDYTDGGFLNPLVFVMLNPSTADDVDDDPTIRRCCGYSSREGYSGVVIVNLYGYRATDPRELWEAEDPVGPANDIWLRWVIDHGLDIVCAWGTQAKPERVQKFARLASGVDLFCLGVNQGGSPKHPLYLRRDQPLMPFKIS